MRHAAETLDELGVPYEKEVVSAHRTPDKLFAYAEAAEARGLQVIIAGAGGAAHLPGMTSSKTLLPVLGVPVESKALQGARFAPLHRADAGGVPVGTLAIGLAGAVNAPRGCDRRARRRGRGSGLPPIARVRPSPCSPRPIRRRDVFARLHRGRSARAHARARRARRSTCAFGSSTRLPTRALEMSASSSSGRTRTRCSSTVSRRAPTRVTYEFENVPVAAARRVPGDSGRTRARWGGIASSRRSSFRSLGVSHCPLRLARRERPSGAREVALPRLRRKRAARRRVGGGPRG